MPNKTATVIVEACDDCPYFDYEYYTWNAKCEKLDREIPRKSYNHPIPDDCPLEDQDGEDKIVNRLCPECVEAREKGEVRACFNPRCGIFQLSPPGTFTVADMDAAVERGKEIGIAMASAPCLFCGKKTNECECGHAEIAKGMIDTEFPSRVQQRAWTLAEYRDWLDNKEQENAD